jgi:hypothetical protein
VTGWKPARRELAVAAGLSIAIATAVWVVLGPTAAGIVLLVGAVISLLALRTLIDPYRQPTALESDYEARPISFTGFWRMQTDLSGLWRMQTDLTDSMTSLAVWDNNLRHRLQNLLAARLAERHDISLAADPQAARRVFTGPDGRDDLWYWIDPSRPTPSDASARRGIPPRVLAALIHRLEQL